MTAPEKSLNVISKKFLEKLLKKPIKSFFVTGGSRPGDNFTSILFSIEVKFENTEIPLHLLLKTYPTHPARKEFLNQTNLFYTELKVYETLIPEYLKLQTTKIGNIEILRPAVPLFVNGRADAFAKEKPQCNGNILPSDMGNTDEINNFILMVDARKLSGFQMADKMIGMDFNHCKLVMVELAKLHALSLAYKVHNGLKTLTQKFPFLEETIFVENSTFIQPMVKCSFEIITKLVEKDLDSETMLSIKKLENKAMHIFGLFLSPNGVNEEIAQTFTRVKQNVNDLERIKDPWIVGGHGDCWINNCMFRYNKNNPSKPVEAMLVDLQICRESCLTIDLAYFFYSSTNHTLRKTHLNDLLGIYHESFLKYCKILNTKPFEAFTLENLKARFHRSKVFGFVFAVLLLPIILQSPENSTNLDDLPATENHENDGVSKNDELVDLMQSVNMTRSGSDENVLKVRFLEMIQELSDEGVL